MPKKTSASTGKRSGRETSQARIGRLSHELQESSSAAALAMESTLADGLPQPGTTVVVISTPRGEVMSVPMEPEEAAAMREMLESDMVRVDHLMLETLAGVVIIPGDLARQSLIRFVTEAHGPAAGTSAKHSKKNA
ncbi:MULTISPECIES: hypothetical protein [Hydrocarboniphaga]|uniref:Uncharacterized protein n=1 Tax=Hydrocarboniphaga effusa AP103 TaxID=1172194 RepID=I7ZIX7_9GAMM|nr:MULTISPECIES: hypothetical protein [Hydrocarboniphaga]EIT71874.1 hypothetical protein WQQ_20110 [Hydrocarboniphaga effusa AP103]MDZ4077425.1 hypothetical protein [Hydrocarboniphaga sp.]